MKFGLDVPTTEAYADPRRLAQLAGEAEAAGWDGFFVWDVLFGGPAATAPVLDPWIALTAIALQTTHLRIGTLVTALARRRPWLVAQRFANLDQLTGGRMICGVGHMERQFTAFGEAGAPDIRAQKLDEGLAVLDGLWRGDPFSCSGHYYTLDQATLHPRPAQAPRIPIWVAGGWPRRAAGVRRRGRAGTACASSRYTPTRTNGSRWTSFAPAWPMSRRSARRVDRLRW